MILKKSKDNVFGIAWKASGTADGAKGTTPYNINLISDSTISKKGRKIYMKAYKKAAMLRLLEGVNNERTDRS